MARGAILSVTKRHLEKIPPAPFAKLTITHNRGCWTPRVYIDVAQKP